VVFGARASGSTGLSRARGQALQHLADDSVIVEEGVLSAALPALGDLLSQLFEIRQGIQVRRKIRGNAPNLLVRIVSPNVAHDLIMLGRLCRGKSQETQRNSTAADADDR
jgi:hypothetical protein